MKSYKLIEITTVYGAYLNDFNIRYPNRSQLSYDELYSLFVNDNFAESDYIHRYFKEMGIRSKILFYNNEELQRKWKYEYKDFDLFSIILKQIEEFQPDVIFVADVSLFSRDQLMKIKQASRNNRVKLVGFYFFVINDAIKDIVSTYDQLYTGSKVFVKQFLDNGINAKLVRHAFEPSNFYKNSCDVRKEQIVFPGNIILGKDVHNNRLDMLNALIEADVPYCFYGNIFGQTDNRSIIKKIKKRFYLSNNQRLIDRIAKIDTSHHRPNVYGDAYYRILSENLICVNCHIPVIGQGAGNMRVFEATGMGACLVTDAKEENKDLFEVDKEIVTFSNMKEFKEKIIWLLNNPNIARDIAIAGQRKTFSLYSYENKAKIINEYIQELL